MILLQNSTIGRLLSHPNVITSTTRKACKAQWWKFELHNTSTTSKAKWWNIKLLSESLVQYPGKIIAQNWCWKNGKIQIIKTCMNYWAVIIKNRFCQVFDTINLVVQIQQENGNARSLVPFPVIRFYVHYWKKYLWFPARLHKQQQASVSHFRESDICINNQHFR